MDESKGIGFRSILFWLLGTVAIGAFIWQVTSVPDSLVNELQEATVVFAQQVDEETDTSNVEDTFVQSEQSVTLFNNLPTINEDSLAPDPNPRTYQAKLPNHNFQTHIVARGETPNVIADQYNISSETLLGGNPWLNQESNALQSGTELVILPVDGVLHEVQLGETLASIAEDYNVAIEEILAYKSNNLEAPFYRLVPETEILIPGAVVGQFYWTAPKSTGGGGGTQQWQIVGTGFFTWPINSRCMTQYYWYGHPGIDVGLPEGSRASAADHGTVTYASWASGTYFDYGNLIVINHGNGFETFYAHLSSINVYPGQIVRQGDFIGLTGNTGRSSGPHVHFEIRYNDFRDDPLFYLGGSVQNC